MRLSTKSRFAVTAMIDVALREDRGPVSLAAISVRHQISLSYLEQLFSKLRQQGLVESTRGPGGGYSLSRNAEKITMADIVGAVDAPSDDEAGADGCWMNSELWASLNEKMLTHQLAPIGGRTTHQGRHRGASTAACRQARRVCQAQKCLEDHGPQFGVCVGWHPDAFTRLTPSDASRQNKKPATAGFLLSENMKKV
jgi:Rrf2 family iron-sulfur cluster assembly transcriptional regulator